MFLPIDNLNSYWQSFYNLYGSDITTLTDKWFNDEAIRGRSCKQYKVNQYYYAFYLAVLIKLELSRWENTLESYYETKYGLADKYNKVACNNISLKNIFIEFGIDFEEEEGIEGMGIEENFIVEPDYTNNYTQVNLLNLINSGTVCTSIYNDCI